MMTDDAEVISTYYGLTTRLKEKAEDACCSLEEIYIRTAR